MAFRVDITGNRTVGGNRPEAIIIHWWGDPSQHPTLSGVVSWFKNPASQVSAHYVVSGSDIVQMVPEADMAWHSMHMNNRSIGIEVDPNTPGVTYETVGQLVAQIRSRCGDLPLRRHSDYVATACPGSLDMQRIERLSKGEDMPIPDTDNYYARYGQDLAMRTRGRELSREEFRINIVGRTDLQAVEILSSGPEAAEVQMWQSVGKVAVRDKWDKQIFDLVDKLKKSEARASELEKQLAAGATQLKPGVYEVK